MTAPSRTGGRLLGRTDEPIARLIEVSQRFGRDPEYSRGGGGNSSFKADGVVYINELDSFVSDRVKVLTDGKQHPVTSKPATIRPFPLTRRK